MSLGLLLPLGLAALAAGLLPLLVHLARREEQRPTDFAALRWLAARLKPRRKLRVEEGLLLALRLLLVAALALLLAKPVLYGGAGDAPWLLVLPGADVSAAPALPEGTQRRWLAPGFPALDTPMPAAGATGSLLRQLDAELPAATPVTVLVTDPMEGADGARPQLARALDWRIVPGSPAPAVQATGADAGFRLVVRHAPGREPALPYLRAAATAWHTADATRDGDAAPDIAAVEAGFPPDTPYLAWLAPGELPAPVRAWIERGGRALLDAETRWPLTEPGIPVWRDGAGEPLAQAARLGRGRVLQLMRPLSPEALPGLLEPDFPQRLRTLLEAPAAAPTRARAAAYAPLPGGPRFPETPRDLGLPLLWLIAALFALERWLATGRREAAP